MASENTVHAPSLGNESVEASIEHAPPLPPRETKPRFKPIYTTKSATVEILAFRQSELYGSQATATPIDALSGRKTELGSRVSAMASDLEGAVDEYWFRIAQNYSDSFVRDGHLADIEEHILQGLPAKLRGVVYMKVLGVHSVVDPNKYQTYLRSAKLAHADEDGDQNELLQVLHYCLNETPSSTLGERPLRSTHFAAKVAPLVAAMDGLSKQEQLSVLSKLARLHSIIDKDDFAYKASRALEDLQPTEFDHIATQGIDISGVMRNALLGIFTGKSFALLDFVLFEGFDYIVRVLCALAKNASSSILALRGDELQEYLKGPFLSCDDDTLELATKSELSLIKYENEFQLMRANSISGNTNELSNLTETNKELQTTVAELTEKLANLKKTHQEIYEQRTDSEKLLAEASQKKQALLAKRAQLEERYAQLTMKENLSNTIQANQDISRGNAEFEVQIAELRAKIETKKAKLKK